MGQRRVVRWPATEEDHKSGGRNEMDLERTLVVVKPDGVQRELVGTIVGRFEQRGFRLIGMKMVWVDRAMAEKHYAVHQGKFFYEGLVSYICIGPVVAMVIEGPEAIATVRAMVGKTKGSEAAPGTIRGDYGLIAMRNLVHASDAPETAASEIALWFRPEEIFNYPRDIDGWVWEK